MKLKIGDIVTCEMRNVSEIVEIMFDEEFGEHTYVLKAEYIPDPIYHLEMLCGPLRLLTKLDKELK